MQIRNYYVDIEDASGAKLGRGPLRVMDWTQKDSLSASGTFSFTASLSDPNLPALREKRVAICRYVAADGSLNLFGGGVIESITRVVDEQGVLRLQVSGFDLTRELTYRSVGALDLSGVGGAGVSDAPVRIMDLAPETWSLSSGLTAQSVYEAFDGESVLQALTRIGEHIGEHWRLGTGRVIEWLGPASGFAASGVRAVQHVPSVVATETLNTVALVTGLEEVSDAADVVSRVYPRGSGNGGAVLTLAAVTEAPPSGYGVNVAENYVIASATETAYERIERALDFKEIGPVSNTTPDVQAAANMLLQAAVEHLRRHAQPQKFYRVSLGHTSARIRPGTTLHVVYRQVRDGVTLYDLDAEFIVLEVERQLSSEGAYTASVLISTIDRLPNSDTDLLVNQIMEGRVVSTHPQLGVSVDTLTFRDEMDNAHGASMRFWIGDEYTSLQRVVLRFRVQPLRSTVKSVAGLSITTNAGGGGTSAAGGSGTSGSGGSSSPTSSSSGSHSHNVTAIPGSGSALTASGGTLYTGAGTPQSFSTDLVGAGHSHTVSIPDHTHTISDHTHTINDHTHEIAPEILMVYGIFEESAANTLELTDLAITLNNGADLRPTVRNINNGWYELDLTGQITDAIYRPIQENNEIAVTTAVAKTARIEAQITIRGVVQAVKYG